MSLQTDKFSAEFDPSAVARDRREARPSRLADLSLRALQPIRRSLRAKFILVIVALQIAVMGAVIVVIEYHQREAIIEQARLRALSLATSLTALSETYLINYDFAKLEQAAERLTADDKDVAYTVAHLHDGVVAVFSWRDDLQGKTLDDPISQKALQATEPLVQEVSLPESGEPGYDVAIPVLIPGSSKKWGTIRVGFSLQRAYGLIHQVRRALLLLSLAAIVCGTSLAVFLAMRISRPIGHLVAAAHELARGSYGRRVHVDASDEIGYLAHAFEQMRASLLRHLENEAEERRRLEASNRKLRDTQQQLIHSERLAVVGKVAARVAHEVNNPLAIIKTAVRIIKNQTGHASPAAGNLQMIEEEISRIARIIQELLEFSRPTPAQESVQVNSIIQGLERVLAQNLQEKQITLKVILDSGLPLVRISSDQLKQVILNIVRNAEDAMPRGGELVIRTARAGGFVELGIADTGCGISEEYRERIFDPFFTTKQQGRGMGLGLAVSYGIIKAVNGHIEVASEVGKGSSFRVRLPSVQEYVEG
ncbi:MAG: ATP-binding protein [Candidatus Tectomicrobia bacterium]|nr:ATP-binding protein [Candidatus Tectomicrobia bacterium]